MICILVQQGWLRRSRLARKPGSDISNETTGNLRLGKAQEELTSSCGILVDGANVREKIMTEANYQN